MLLYHLFLLLLSLPETAIRDKAVNSFSGIITLFAAVDHTHFLSLAPLSIFSKVSCCMLLPFFPSTPKTLAHLADLSNDPAPLVSKQLALVYHRIPAPPVSLANRLAHDRSWRCHLQTIKLIPELITPLFDCQDELVKVSTSTLVDPVNATRMVVLG